MSDTGKVIGLIKALGGSGGGGSSGGGVFLIGMTSSEDPESGSTTYTLQKTYNEIKTACVGGLIPVIFETGEEDGAWFINYITVNGLDEYGDYRVYASSPFWDEQYLPFTTNSASGYPERTEGIK